MYIAQSIDKYRHILRIDARIKISTHKRIIYILYYTRTSIIFKSHNVTQHTIIIVSASLDARRNKAIRTYKGERESTYACRAYKVSGTGLGRGMPWSHKHEGRDRRLNVIVRQQSKAEGPLGESRFCGASLWRLYTRTERHRREPPLHRQFYRPNPRLNRHGWSNNAESTGEGWPVSYTFYFLSLPLCVCIYMYIHTYVVVVQPAD